MKFTVAALLAALATTCFAQTVYIAYPLNNTSVAPGDVIPVKINFPESQKVRLYTAGFFIVPNRTEIDFIGRDVLYWDIRMRFGSWHDEFTLQ